MNGEREFNHLLKSMEDELLALKTAHERPLGTLNFFQNDIEFNLNISAGAYAVAFNLVVEIVPPSATPPIVQVGWEIPNGFYDVNIMQSSVNNDYSVWSYKLMLTNNGSAETVNFKAGAISAQPISSITWSYA